MKKILFLFLIYVGFLYIGCQKDELEASVKNQTPELYSGVQDSEVSPRNGSTDLFFYRGSLSSDNYLLLNSTNRLSRTHTVYNKNKVAYINFKSGNLPKINVGGVLSSHYLLEVKYKDSTYTTFTAYSKDTIPKFKYIPKGQSLLHSSHPSKKIEWVYSGKTSSTINEFRGTAYTNLQVWNIYADGKFLASKIKEPYNSSMTQFSIPHSNN